ncbi:MAG TPA: cobalt transporter [Leptolyngbyaceae cyanobacterium M33_DOE_097]|uniref:Cobalt transporter n=1 Tax=Oscillatoriales cyanobacterium SpSt-418 TaxID=2282169 RepID=A0A7C3PJ61_9CYAN|nr:cobalt transporter [Leptolyngbyaceae cyanobacterium M33_DOE_097]
MRYPQRPFLEAVLVTILLLSVPKAAVAHVGHGDEFQATGGIERVQVNAETDQMLGIVATPIEPAADGSSAIMVPATAVVDADGKQLVFVQYNDFYEPVEVTTGAAQGELIEITQGLSVGENLVTQGSLSLYAESRKTQAAPSPDAIASPQTSPQAADHAQADAAGIAHSHDAAGNMTEQPGDAAGDVAQRSGGFPIGWLAALGGGAALLVGAIAVLGGGRKKKSAFSDKKGGY